MSTFTVMTVILSGTEAQLPVEIEYSKKTVPEVSKWTPSNAAL